MYSLLVESLLKIKTISFTQTYIYIYLSLFLNIILFVLYRDPLDLVITNYQQTYYTNSNSPTYSR